MNSTTPPPAITDGDVTGYILVPFFIITAIGVAVVVVSSWLVWLKQNMMSRTCTVCVILFLCFRSCICGRKGGKLCSQLSPIDCVVQWVVMKLIFYQCFVCCLSELTGSAISWYQYIHMTLQRNFMKLNKKCCGEKRTQGYDDAHAFTVSRIRLSMLYFIAFAYILSRRHVPLFVLLCSSFNFAVLCGYSIHTNNTALPQLVIHFLLHTHAKLQNIH